MCFHRAFDTLSISPEGGYKSRPDSIGSWRLVSRLELTQGALRHLPASAGNIHIIHYCQKGSFRPITGEALLPGFLYCCLTPISSSSRMRVDTPLAGPEAP